MQVTHPAVGSFTRGALFAGGIIVGLMAVGLTWRGPAFALAGSSPFLTIAELTAGWVLLAVGVVSSVRRPTSSFGWILALAGVAWFLVDWPNPASAGSIVFSVGLLGRAAYPVVLAHASLIFPDGRFVSRLERITILVGYVTNLVVLGLIPALFFEPDVARCAACPDNFVAIDSRQDLVALSISLGLGLEVVWTSALIALSVLRLAEASRSSRRLVGPVLLPATVFLSLVAIDAIHSFQRGGPSNDPVDVALWLGQALAIVVLGAGVELERVRARRARQQVAKVTLDLAGSPPTGHLRESLAVTLGDPLLQVAYAIGDGRLADAHGHPVKVVVEPGRTMTRVERGADLVAVLSHRSDLLDDPVRLKESIATARMAVENERLQAGVRVQLEDLRASRARIVEASDRERRRLERDLHDGAQQRLVALSLEVGLARLQLRQARDDPDAQHLAEVDNELREALSELREVAHGIYPTELVDGLGAGVGALAEAAPIPIEISTMPSRQLEPTIVGAAYFVIAQVILRSGATKAIVGANLADGRLLIDIEALGAADIDLVAMEDRVGALDGTVTTRSDAGAGVRIHAEIPCAS